MLLYKFKKLEIVQRFVGLIDHDQINGDLLPFVVRLHHAKKRIGCYCSCRTKEILDRCLERERGKKDQQSCGQVDDHRPGYLLFYLPPAEQTLQSGG